MLLLITGIVFLISNLSLAITSNDPKNGIVSKEHCGLQGDECQKNDDCCSDLSCYTKEEHSRCLPSKVNERGKRYTDDLIIPPYYNPKNQLYPYVASKPALSSYKVQEPKQTVEGKNLEWDQCQFHEECGEGNCCYNHFRFRSTPKWFCRPNRNDASELCQPLTKYSSLKDIPAWKKQQAAKKEDEYQR